MTRVAHVGVSADKDSTEQYIWADNDRSHLDAVFDWLYKNTDDSELLYDRQDDFIDLNDGRDFLRENHSYDIVILHAVYNPLDDSLSGNFLSGNGIFKLSDIHSKRSWRERLLKTNAKYIFTFGDLTEVSGNYIGKLPGYSGPIGYRNYMYVYVLEDIQT